MFRKQAAAPLATAASRKKEPVRIESPGSEEGVPKNQDRISWFPFSNKPKVACVCDGVGSSPYSAEAARIVSEQAYTFFDSAGHLPAIETMRRVLLEHRALALQRPIILPVDLSDGMREMLLTAATRKLQQSYQTTIVAVEIVLDDTGLSLRLLRCGDSQLLVYGLDGEILYPPVPLNHLTNATDGLPDSPDEAIVWEPNLHFTDVEAILLTSDGFLDAFDSPADLHTWLIEHESALSTAESQAPIFTELHRQLAERRGDDDISFIWIRPGDLIRVAAEK